MKKHLLTALAFLTILILALTACSNGDPNATEPEYKIKIQLVYPTDYVSVLTDEVYITPGEDAVFSMVVAPGCTVELDEAFDSTFENNKLTISGVRYPSTYVLNVTPDNVQSGDGSTYMFYYESGTGGTVVSSERSGQKLLSGTKVTLTATPLDDYTFLGWSTGKLMSLGGTLVSENPTTTVTITGTTLVYANYKHKDEVLIRYHLNGGTVKGTNSDVYYDTFPTDYYYFPNAVGDLGTFVRDGYTILEYTENPDGTGFVTCPGGKIFTDKKDVIDVYVQWSKWSDASLFTYESVSGGIAITSYTGNENTVSVPAKIGGKTVVTIRSGAFTGKSMETLVLPNTIKTIEDGAIKNCSSFTTLYMFDTIMNITDSFYQNSNAFKNFRFSAARKPVHSDIWGAYSRKLERIVALGLKENVLVVISGSSSLYATDSPLLEELLADAGYDFAVCNLGIQAGIPQYAHLDFLQDFLDDGDLIIQAPEINSSQNSNAFTETLVSVYESMYNAFRYLDISKHTSVFSSIATYNQNRASMETMKYSDHRRVGYETNIYGDWIKENKQGTQNISGSIKPNGSTFGSATATRYNEMYNYYAAKGVRIYFSIPAMYRSAYKSTPEQADAYENLVDTLLLAPRIFTVEDYVLDDNYFFNSVYHTNEQGAVVRTNQLAKDILAQFAKEGN